MMQPDLELVHIRKGESFAAWRHGYPFRTVRWHYHPEYEIHLVVATSGTFYIGDFVGRFDPGQLIMTGPNLPQNWISEIEPEEIVPTRSLVIQFPEAFIEKPVHACQRWSRSAACWNAAAVAFCLTMRRAIASAFDRKVDRSAGAYAPRALLGNS